MKLNANTYYSVEELRSYGLNPTHIERIERSLIDKGATLEEGILGGIVLHYEKKHRLSPHQKNSHYVNVFLFSTATGIPLTDVLAKRNRDGPLAKTLKVNGHSDVFLSIDDVGKFIRYQSRPAAFHRSDEKISPIKFEISLISDEDSEESEEDWFHSYDTTDSLEHLKEIEKKFSSAPDQKSADLILEELIETDNSFEDTEWINYDSAELAGLIYEQTAEESPKESDSDVDPDRFIDLMLNRSQVLDNEALAQESLDIQQRIWADIHAYSGIEELITDILSNQHKLPYTVCRTHTKRRGSTKKILDNYADFTERIKSESLDAQQIANIYCTLFTDRLLTLVYDHYKHNPQAQQQAPGIKRIKAIRDEIVTSNLKWVSAIARKYSRHPDNFSDHFNQGVLGLLNAVDTYDVTLGFKFTTYATWWIKQSIIRKNKHEDNVRKPAHIHEMNTKIEHAIHQMTNAEIPTTNDFVTEYINTHLDPPQPYTSQQVRFVREAQKKSLSLDMGFGPEGNEITSQEFIEDKKAQDPSAHLMHESDRSIVDDLFSYLPPHKNQLLRLRYGLPHTPLTYKQISRLLDIPEVTIKLVEQQVVQEIEDIGALESLTKEHVLEVLDGFNEVERKIILCRAGFGNQFDLFEAAAIFGTDRLTIRKMESTALRTLKLVSRQLGLTSPF